jgi:hypothetical protein
MMVTIERVSTFNLRNLLGYDCADEVLRSYADCFTKSTAIWLAKADGVEACAVGVIPPTIFSSKAYLWLIHTKLCEQHPLRFIRWSRKVMDEILATYPNIYGLCHPDNVSGRAWLEWLGAKFAGEYNNHYTFEIR